MNQPVPEEQVQVLLVSGRVPEAQTQVSILQGLQAPAILHGTHAHIPVDLPNHQMPTPHSFTLLLGGEHSRSPTNYFFEPSPILFFSA